MRYGELYEGILGSTNPDEHEHQFREFLRIADVLPFTATTMQCFARIRMDLRARGMLIRDADLLIAATAMTEDLTLVTGNLRHFERIDGLDIYRAGRS
jgi:predicted nucleic acid-binding protein